MADKTSSSSKTDFILNGSVYRVILLISLPLIANSITIKVFDSINVYFASTIGPTELTAISFVNPVKNIPYSILTALSVAITSYFSAVYIKYDKKKAIEMVSGIFYVFLAIFAVVIVLNLIFAKDIILMLGATSNIYEATYILFLANFAAVFFDYIIYFYFGLTRAKGNMHQTFTYTLTENIIRLIITVICLMVFDLGVVGLCIALIVSKLIVGSYCIKTMLKENWVSKKIYFSMKILKEFLLIMFPATVEKFAMTVGFVIINAIIILIGEDVLSAFSITNSMNSIFFTPTIAIGTAIITLISINLEMKNFDRCRELVRKSTIIVLAYSIVSSFILVLGAPVIAKLYSADSENLYSLILDAMYTYSWSIIGYGLAQLYFGVYYAIKKPSISMALSITRLFIFRVLVILILVRVFDFGADGVWYGMAISNFALLPIIYIIQKSKMFTFEKRSKILTERDLV